MNDYILYKVTCALAGATEPSEAGRRWGICVYIYIYIYIYNYIYVYTCVCV